MDRKTLKVFLTLAETLHFAKTSEACHMTPSALSRAIKRLEDDVGERLFIRDNRSVQLTRAGTLFIAYATESLQRWEAFQHSLERDSHSLKGELRLYCSVTASYSILSAILHRFRQKYAGIEIKLRTGDQAESISRVLAQEDDISIAARPDKLEKKLSFQMLTYSPLCFIGPAIPCAVLDQIHHQRAKGEDFDWQNLPLILSEQGLARQRLNQWLKHKGIRPNIYAQVSGHEAIVSMVGLGFGVGVVPELVIQNSPLQEKIQVLNVEPQLEPFAIGLCALTQQLRSPLLKAFWTTAQELMSESKLP